MYMTPKTLIAIPAYNEEECIEKTICELRQIAPEFDFVVINDGSRDRTLAARILVVTSLICPLTVV